MRKRNRVKPDMIINVECQKKFAIKINNQIINNLKIKKEKEL